MKNTDRITLLEEAQDGIESAAEKIMEAVKGTSREAYCERYIVAHLLNWANGTETLDTTIPKLIQKLELEDEL